MLHKDSPSAKTFLIFFFSRIKDEDVQNTVHTESLTFCHPVPLRQKTNSCIIMRKSFLISQGYAEKADFGAYYSR